MKKMKNKLKNPLIPTKKVLKFEEVIWLFLKGKAQTKWISPEAIYRFCKVNKIKFSRESFWEYVYVTKLPKGGNL